MSYPYEADYSEKVAEAKTDLLADLANEHTLLKPCARCYGVGTVTVRRGSSHETDTAEERALNWQPETCQACKGRRFPALIAEVEKVSKRAASAAKLQQLTLANELRWMRNAAALEAVLGEILPEFGGYLGDQSGWECSTCGATAGIGNAPTQASHESDCQYGQIEAVLRDHTGALAAHDADVRRACVADWLDANAESIAELPAKAIREDAAKLRTHASTPAT